MKIISTDPRSERPNGENHCMGDHPTPQEPAKGDGSRKTADLDREPRGCLLDFGSQLPSFGLIVRGASGQSQRSSPARKRQDGNDDARDDQGCERNGGSTPTLPSFNPC